jgi:hypothetical protein
MVDVKEVQKSEVKDVIMTVRTTKEGKAFMQKHKISPSKLFDKALNELRGGK